MDTYLLLTALTALLIAVNLPLGYLRRGHERFAYGWYFYLYLSLPVVVYLKAKTGYDWKLIPVLLCGAVLGQILGGAFAQRRWVGQYAKFSWEIKCWIPQNQNGG